MDPQIRAIIIKKVVDANPPESGVPQEIASILNMLARVFNIGSNDADKLANNDGVALITQHVNNMAKTDDRSWYDCKNMLTRWLAKNHDGSFFDGEKKILYVPMGNGRQVSFHVHHDIGDHPEAAEFYNHAAERTPVEWDGISRQDISSDYLQEAVGNEEAAEKVKANEMLQTNPEEFFKQEMSVKKRNIEKKK